MRPHRPHRILMTADAVGGVWSYCLALAEALGGRAEILLAVMGPRPTAAQCDAAGAIPTLRLATADLRLEWDPGADADLACADAWLRELAASFNPDIVHVNGYAAAAAGWSVPVVVVAHSCVLSWWHAVHGMKAPAAWNGYAERVERGLACADHVIAPSQTMLRALSRFYRTAPRSSSVIFNGCAIGRYAPKRKRRFVFAAGRLWDEGKNLRALDAAAAALPWPVLAAGSARRPDGSTTRPRHIRALGELAPAVIAEWMAHSAMFVAPARYEPFGLSVLEAAASGCALVLGDIASLRELWDGAALFIPPDDAAGIAAAIDALMRDDEGRAARAAAARERAQRYDAVTMGDRYAALYGAMLEEHASDSLILANGV